jgi:hypothetical protein
VRTVATFESDSFNLKQARPYFINQDCFGDDLATWLIDKIRRAGAIADAEPKQEDFGWYVNYSVNGQPFCAVIGSIGGQCWFIVVERIVGLLGSPSGARNRCVPVSGIELIHNMLSSAPEIRKLRWHDWASFKRGGVPALLRGAESP